MSTKRAHFDLQAQLRKALDWILEHRYTRLDGSRWFSASDLERRLRAAAAEVMDGKPYGSYSQDTPYFRGGPRFQGLNGDTLLGVCRRFLGGRVQAGELDANNPANDYHCSGMRFRPRGEELAASEKRTLAVPRSERHKKVSHLKHVEVRTYERPDGTTTEYTVTRPACQANKKERRFTFRPSHPWYNEEKPSCKHCQRILAARHAAAAARVGLSPDAPPEAVHDALEEMGS